MTFLPPARRLRTAAAAMLALIATTACGAGTVPAPAAQIRTARPTSPAAARTVTSATPVAGRWWGAALDAPDSALPAAVSTREQATGRRLDLVHTYHRWDDRFPTAAELRLSRSGHALLVNWEPVTRSGRYLGWGAIAAGAQDAEIDVLARRLAAVTGPVLVTFSHEPELSYHRHGSASEFAAAFRHVVQRARAAGAGRVRWVWDVMGLPDPVWLDRYTQMWPGDGYVDWIAWDPYNFASCRNRSWHDFSATVTPFYRWLDQQSFAGKPEMLAEYGSIEQPGHPTAKAAWLAGIPAALNALPRLRALVYFDLPAPPANCDWLVGTSSAARNAFAALARSAPFRSTATAAIGQLRTTSTG